MSFIIYKLTCLITQKAYIGYTSKSLQWRWDRHVRCALHNEKYRNVLLGIAIRKHGVDAWKQEVLDTVSSKEEALACEVRMIEFHKTFYLLEPNVGYNMTRGGEGGPGRSKGFTMSDSHRNKISSACKGLKRSQEAIEKSRKAHIGMKRSIETRQKIQNARATQVCSEETRQKMSSTRQKLAQNPLWRAKLTKKKTCKNCGVLGHQARTCNTPVAP